MKSNAFITTGFSATALLAAGIVASFAAEKHPLFKAGKKEGDPLSIGALFEQQLVKAFDPDLKLGVDFFFEEENSQLRLVLPNAAVRHKAMQFVGEHDWSHIRPMKVFTPSEGGYVADFTSDEFIAAVVTGVAQHQKKPATAVQFILANREWSRLLRKLPELSQFSAGEKPRSPHLTQSAS